MPPATPRAIALLGSTGSIGRQTLEVIAEHSGRFRVVALAASRSAEELIRQAQRWQPEVVAVADPGAAAQVERSLRGRPIEVLAGPQGLEVAAAWPSAHLVVGAVSGAAGLRSLLAAIDAGKDVAVANKEPLVAAGALVMERVLRQGTLFLPIDSEHSAIFQCLQGSAPDTVAQLWLTASGGPFRALSRQALEQVGAEQALQHPTWDMGPKITIDSATLMNKGLEVIEAHWLFGVPVDRIRIVIHPQSIVHSLVEFVDGSFLAQMDRPDMRSPIQFALTYPERWPTWRAGLDLPALSQLGFEEPDLDRFPCPRLAYQAARAGGTLPAVMNAANEEAVGRFLRQELGFMDIPRLIDDVMARHRLEPVVDLETVLAADRWARIAAREWTPTGKRGGAGQW